MATRATRALSVAVLLTLCSVAVARAQTRAPAAEAATAVDPARDDSLAIAEAARAFSRAYVEGDSATIASLYTEDALLLPPGRDVRGREGAVRWFYAPPARRPREHHLQAEALRIHGDIATDVGHWNVVNAAGEEFRGRYLVVWRKDDDGRWRMMYDMWHSPPD